MRETNERGILDDTTASVARVYDLSLGGTDYYEVDRLVWNEILAVAPHQGQVGKINRRWLVRAVTYLAREPGIDQFLDLGSGLPTMENTHEVAQRRNPDAKVVYVDNDPVVTAHGRALMEENVNTLFVEADLMRPTELLHDPAVTRFLDFEQPIALMLCATLHHVGDFDDVRKHLREYLDVVPSGSYIVLSHFWDPGDENPELHRLARSLERTFTASSMGSGWWRSRAQITQLFEGTELIAPGVVELDDWWPVGPRVREPYPEERMILCGIGRKP